MHLGVYRSNHAADENEEPNHKHAKYGLRLERIGIDREQKKYEHAAHAHNESADAKQNIHDEAGIDQGNKFFCELDILGRLEFFVLIGDRLFSLGPFMMKEIQSHPAYFSDLLLQCLKTLDQAGRCCRLFDH